jgi:hypothetical protein
MQQLLWHNALPGTIRKSMTRRWFGICLVAGCVLRGVGFWLPGTPDVSSWKIWSYHAATKGPAHLYGSDPHRQLEYAGIKDRVTYPPLALEELALAGWLYQQYEPTFADSQTFTAIFKLEILAADVGLALFFLLALPKFGVSAEGTRGAVAALWLNPASLLSGAAHGYIDVLYYAPVASALVAAALGRPAISGALLAAAVLTKLQALLISPAVVLFIVATGGWRAVLRAALGGLIICVVICAPLVVAGSLTNMVRNVGTLAQHDLVSGRAANAWWIIGYIVDLVSGANPTPTITSFGTQLARSLRISTMTELGYPNPRPLGVAAFLLVWAWAAWRTRGTRDVFLAAGLGAFMLHAYFVLSAQVHENHSVGAIPLLVLAAAGRRAFRPILIAFTAVVAINLYLFYGLDGMGRLMIPRGVTILDASVVLAALNIGLLVWHGKVLRTEAARLS